MFFKALNEFSIVVSCGLIFFPGYFQGIYDFKLP